MNSWVTYPLVGPHSTSLSTRFRHENYFAWLPSEDVTNYCDVSIFDRKQYDQLNTHTACLLA